MTPLAAPRKIQLQERVIHLICAGAAYYSQYIVKLPVHTIQIEGIPRSFTQKSSRHKNAIHKGKDSNCRITDWPLIDHHLRLSG